ncbi:prepilin-type N-terminal cleavage/methylation domain-containing protein [Vallitaleaceae bacterium 9-2]
MNKKSDGVTLMELIVVIAILGIIAALAVRKLIGFRSKTEGNVCAANRKTIEKMYSAFLVEKDIDYEDIIFNQFGIENFDEICSAGGVISYEDGKV